MFRTIFFTPRKLVLYKKYSAADNSKKICNSQQQYSVCCIMLSPTGIPLFTSPASRREGEGGNKKITTIRLLSFSHHAATKRKCNWRGHSFSSLQFHASPSHGTPLLFLFSLPLFGEKRRKRLFPFLRQASAELSIGGAASIYPPFSAFSSLSLSLSLHFFSPSSLLGGIM